MISHRIPTTQDGIDWLFMTATFAHRGVNYCAAVAQNSDVANSDAGHAGHNYHVVRQSDDTFSLWKGEEEL